MGTLIRIRNACFSYRKSEVVSFFQDIEWKKVELYGFFQELSLKKVELCGFSELFFKKWRYARLFRENVEKNGVIAFALS